MIQERVATLWKGEAAQSRWPMWKRMAPLAQDFPLWGTGLGTFTFTEGLRQETTRDVHTQLEHAHNDYLEILLEGGVVGLLLGLAATVLVLRLGYRAARHGPSRAARGLALGALMSFAILVIESLGDFSLHIPAVAVLATAVTAHLCGAGDGWQSAKEGGVPAGAYRLRLGGLAPLAGAATCAALALALFGAGWRAHRIDRLRVAGSQAAEAKPEDGLEERVAYLERAVRLAPAKADLQNELGEARVKLFEGAVRKRQQRRKLAAFVGAVAAGRCDWAAALGWLSAESAVDEVGREVQKEVAREYLLPALRQFVKARDCCPLLRDANLSLATHGLILAQADTRDAYLRRAKRLSGGDPETWFLCGVQEWLAKDHEQARASWRRSLDLSDRHLPEVLAVIRQELSPREIFENVIPDRPGVLYAAAVMLYPETELRAERRPFLEKALHLLESSGPLQPEDLRLQAMVYKMLGQNDEAIRTYLKALTSEPDNHDWRCELAQVYFDANKVDDARRELVVVLSQMPGHRQARDLMAIVVQALRGK
jgi:tetratricopeptide (TPR) repeat protein